MVDLVGPIPSPGQRHTEPHRLGAIRRIRKDTKAGLDGFAQGLGDALQGTGARVMVVRPAFVATRMTEGRDPAPFATTADAVAEEIAKGLAKGAEVVWAPPVLRYVFSVMRHLPRPLWRKVAAR